MYNTSLDFFYALALAEGEGLGTAYEYIVRNRFFKAIFRKIKKPHSVLIAGLPEKYGFCLDFIWLAYSFGCNIVIAEDRPKVIKEISRVINRLSAMDILHADHIHFIVTENLYNLKQKENKYYDLVFSPSVLQRMPDDHRTAYFKALSCQGQHIILFVPNKGNSAHPGRTGLKGLKMDEILGYSIAACPKQIVLDAGSLDLPPFPPGARIPSRHQDLISSSRYIRSACMGFLNGLSKLEFYYPQCIKNRFAHLLYLAIQCENEKYS